MGGVWEAEGGPVEAQVSPPTAPRAPPHLRSAARAAGTWGHPPVLRGRTLTLTLRAGSGEARLRTSPPAAFHLW